MANSKTGVLSEIDKASHIHFAECFKEAKEIVQEVAKDGGWIPCSERLPNKEEYVKDDGRFIVTDGIRRYMTHFDIYETQRFGVPQLNGFCEDTNVLAWQPLPPKYEPKPAPYQKGE